MRQAKVGSHDALSSRKPPKRKPSVREADAIKKAVAYCRTRTEPLAYDITKVRDGEAQVDIPHDDKGGYLALMRATFGTVSSEFASITSSQVFDVTRQFGEKQSLHGRANAGIAAISGIEPQNEAEAMLAVQMVGTHHAAVDMLVRARHAITPDMLERYGTLATKLLRTYTTQLEALAKVRRGGAQKVVVEHVHVHAGGQAIVGNVAGGQGGPGGGHIENGSQPHELTGPAAIALQADPSMLRQDAGRDALPVASDAGKETVPQARRSQGKRRTEGGAERGLSNRNAHGRDGRDAPRSE